MRVRRPPLPVLVLLAVAATYAAIFVPLFDGMAVYPTTPASTEADAVSEYARENLRVQLSRRYETAGISFEVRSATAAAVELPDGTFARATVRAVVDGRERRYQAFYYATPDRIASARVASSTGGAPDGRDRPASERVDVPVSAVAVNFANATARGHVEVSGPGGTSRSVTLTAATAVAANRVSVAAGVYTVAFHSDHGTGRVRVDVTPASPERVGVVFLTPDGSIRAVTLPHRH